MKPTTTTLTNDFRGDFIALTRMLEAKEPFAFTRFSDGELLILQNRRIVISGSEAFAHDRWGRGQWGEEEHKTFTPGKDEELRLKLHASFVHRQPNYFKGICCKCCVGEQNWAWQFGPGNLTEAELSEKTLTWANLLINANYSFFVQRMVPLFSSFPVVVVVNEKANLTTLPFYNSIVKDFRVGQNCHISGQHLIFDMTKWVTENPQYQSGTLFLFGAASLSNLLIHSLFSAFPNNTYMDVGSTMNPMMGLDGWKGSRDYLRAYWLGEKNALAERVCVW